MKIKKGDNVLILSGKDRGKTGKVLDVFPRESKVIIEGMNLKKRHERPRRAGAKGQIVTKPAPLFVSKLKLICQKCSKPARVGYKVLRSKKVRVCKKCGAELE